MRPVSLPEAQFQNFAKVLEVEMGKGQEDEGIGPEEAFLTTATTKVEINSFQNF